MPVYKAQLHIHVKGDRQDKIKYTAKEAIDKAAKDNFSIAAITCHKKVIFGDDIKNYGESKGVTVIPGIELQLGLKDVIVLNTSEDPENIKNFNDLREYKKNNPYCFILAPHPFHYLPNCLGKKLIKNIDIFDGIEWNYFYSEKFNPNKKAEKIARQYNKPLIGTSDVHDLKHFDHTYTEIHAKNRTAKAVIEALKQGNVSIHTESFSVLKLFKLLWDMYKATH